MDTLTIIDVNGKQRVVKSNLKIVTHNRQNCAIEFKNENIDGELVKVPEEVNIETDEKFIEVVIVGKSREWVEWYPLKDFERHNPSIKILN